MGEIRNYICNNCKHAWSRSEGMGFRAISLHCDSCGNEKMVGIEDANQKHVCKCGGKLTSKSKKIICTNCHSENVDFADDTVMMWD